MNVWDAAILAGITAAAAAAAVHIYKTKGHSCGCCSACSQKCSKADEASRGALGRHAAKDYPYSVTMRIGGMSCGNCARNVENALNALPGTLAKVDIAGKSAFILLKNEPDEMLLRKAVVSAGYTVTGFES